MRSIHPKWVGLDILITMEDVDLLVRLRTKQKLLRKQRDRTTYLQVVGLEKQVDRLLSRLPDPNENHLFNPFKEEGK